VNKILIALAFCFFQLHATQDNVEPKQKQIRTMRDFIELEKTLKASKLIQPMKANYYLGLLYMSSHTLENGKKILPNYEKALPFLEESLEQGNILAAYSLAMLFLTKKDIDQSMFVLDMTLGSIDSHKEKNQASGAYLSAALGSIVLDFNPHNQEAIAVAIKYLNIYTKNRNMPSGVFLLSQLYLAQNNIGMANKTLTKACSNSELPAELQSACVQLRHQK